MPAETERSPMADFPPSTLDRDADVTDEDPLVLGLDGERTDEVLAALSSETARSMLTALHEEPAPPSQLADRVDTTLQNTQYHLEKLADAGLVTEAGTVYSEKGREMTVYAPADRALVVVAGPETQTDGIAATLKRLLPGVGALALGSLVVEEVLSRTPPTLTNLGGSTGSGETGEKGGSDGVSSATPTPEEADAGATTATATPETTAAETTTEAARTVAESTATSTPAATGTPAPTGTPMETVTEAATATEAATRTARETVATATPQATEMAAGGGPGPLDVLASSPGTLFFLGGLTVLVGVVVLSRR